MQPQPWSQASTTAGTTRRKPRAGLASAIRSRITWYSAWARMRVSAANPDVRNRRSAHTAARSPTRRAIERPNSSGSPAAPSSLALATAIATIVLFAIGGLVRGTGSGLGCSSWPACEPGRLFPTGTIHSLIEFSHRAAAFLVLVLSGLTGFTALRTARDQRAIRWPAVIQLPLVVAQAVVGAVVVATDLDPWWVTAHFVVALLLIADVTYVAAATRFPPGLAIDRSFRGLA